MADDESGQKGLFASASSLLSTISTKTQAWLSSSSSTPTPPTTPPDEHAAFVQWEPNTPPHHASLPPTSSTSSPSSPLILPVSDWVLESPHPPDSYDPTLHRHALPFPPLHLVHSFLAPAGPALAAFSGRFSDSASPVVAVCVPSSGTTVLAILSSKHGHTAAYLDSSRLPLYAPSLFSPRTITIRSFTHVLAPHLVLVPGSEARLATPETADDFLSSYASVLSRELQSVFKIGVLSVHPGQSHEDEILSNAEMGDSLSSFMDAIADQVSLSGFSGYAGGLDTSGRDLTGPFSYYAKTGPVHDDDPPAEEEIMFHVAPLLPHDSTSEQQLLRKRHVGNDVVLLVVLEEGAGPYVSDTLVCRFNHVIVAVQYLAENEDGAPQASRYVRISVAHAFDIPYRLPLGGHPPPYPDAPHDVYDTLAPWFRPWFLSKLVAAETTAIQSSHFSTLSQRTRSVYLDDLLPPS